jgi:hypothetical protein
MGLLLDKFEKLIVEHGSAAVRADHIALLREELLAAEKHIAKLETDNATLINENRNLRHQLATQIDLSWESPYYWRVNDDGTRDGPFCQHCADTDRKAVRLQGPPAYRRGYWKCTVCRNEYQDKDYNPAEDVVLRGGPDPRFTAF